MIDIAWAQQAGAAPPNPVFQMMPAIALVMVLFYFLVLRPQQEKDKKRNELLANLKKNDEIVTAGGLYGRVIALNGDVLTVEIAQNVRVRVQRSAISSVAGRSAEDKDKDKEKAKEN